MSVDLLPIILRRARTALLVILAMAWSSLSLAQGSGLIAGITPYCVPTPIPTDPGPRASQANRFQAEGGTLEVIYWRQPCTEGDGQLIVTFIPVTGAPLVCGGGRNVLVQDGRETSSFHYVSDVDGRANQLVCGPLHAPISAMVLVYDSDFGFDDDAEIVFRTVWGPEDNPNVINFPVAAYANGPATPYIYPHGNFSGSYYDPARPGEGVVLEIGEIGERRILLVSWYTYEQGQPLWILGNVDFESGDQIISVPLSTYAGARFGGDFVPSDVVASPWGEVRVSFPTCQHVNLDWVRFADGLSGTYAYTRIAERLLGTACTAGSASAPAP